jgi:pSer/pThr/pTyr-binding forkhead associated (FHA) protein
LTLIFQGRKIPILGEQFIIGRGSKSSDLAIKDANISRKHAAIILHNGVFYIKDLGSTNGIEYNGKQVDSKRIDEGDVFTICGYDLHFTYQA